MKKLFILLSISIVLGACGKKTSDSDQQAESTPQYKLNLHNANLQWEAYKFTERKGVKGSFDSIVYEQAVDTGSMEELISGLGFEIHTASVNSGDEIRDPKIITHFFGSMLSSEVIHGKISSFEMTSDFEAAVNVDITMNDKTVSVPSTIQFLDAVVQLKTVIDLAQWEAAPAVDSLNRVCEDLHKGSDGLSKLWPDVAITVNTTRTELVAD